MHALQQRDPEAGKHTTDTFTKSPALLVKPLVYLQAQTQQLQLQL
jgi:hypothetical protein